MARDVLLLLITPSGWLWVTSLLVSIATLHAVTERLASALTASYRAYHRWEFVELCHDGPFVLARHTVGAHNIVVRILTSDLLYVGACFVTIGCATGSVGLCVLAFVQNDIESSVSSELRFLLVGMMSGLYYLMLRSPLGLDGSSYMLSITGCSVLLSSILPAGGTGFGICVWFVCAQLILSYFLAGVTKVFGAVWRDGTAVGLILGSRHYGLRWGYSFFERHAFIGRLVTHAVLVFELGFVFILVLPHSCVVGLLVIAFAFHLANATLMGLGQFVPAFLAAYPAVFYCWCQLWGTFQFAAPGDPTALARNLQLTTVMASVCCP